MSRRKPPQLIIAEPVGLDLPVLVVPRGKNKPKISAKLRARVFARDEYRCVKCGVQTPLTVDHVIPRSAGGSNRFENMQTLCEPCNHDKDDNIEPPKSKKRQ